MALPYNRMHGEVHVELTTCCGIKHFTIYLSDYSQIKPRWHNQRPQTMCSSMKTLLFIGDRIEDGPIPNTFYLYPFRFN
jgi:hypothetical protein